MGKKSNSNKFFEYWHFLDFSWPSWPPLRKKASFANAEIFSYVFLKYSKFHFILLEKVVSNVIALLKNSKMLLKLGCIL